MLSVAPASQVWVGFWLQPWAVLGSPVSRWGAPREAELISTWLQGFGSMASSFSVGLPSRQTGVTHFFPMRRNLCHQTSEEQDEFASPPQLRLDVLSDSHLRGSDLHTLQSVARGLVSPASTLTPNCSLNKADYKHKNSTAHIDKFLIGIQTLGSLIAA